MKQTRFYVQVCFFHLFLIERVNTQVGRGRGRSRVPAEQGTWQRTRTQDPWILT